MRIEGPLVISAMFFCYLKVGPHSLDGPLLQALREHLLRTDTTCGIEVEVYEDAITEL